MNVGFQMVKLEILGGGFGRCYGQGWPFLHPQGSALRLGVFTANRIWAAFAHVKSLHSEANMPLSPSNASGLPDRNGWVEHGFFRQTL